MKLPAISGYDAIKTLRKGTLERIIKDAGLTTDEFLQLL